MAASPMVDSDDRTARDNALIRYKEILRHVLDARPSGTRRRLAEALGKNRSFISQISSPAYPTPLPARYVDRVLELCRFSSQEREEFLEAYRQAHPRGRRRRQERSVSRHLTLRVPDFGDPARNRAFDHTLEDFALRMARLVASGTEH